MVAGQRNSVAPTRKGLTMQKCEKCGKRKRDVFRRAEHGWRVCGKCHRDILRGGCQTGLVPRLRLERAE